MRKWTMIALVIALALSGVGTAFAAGPDSTGSGAYAAAGQNAGPVAQAGVTIADVSVTTSPGLLPSLKDIQGTKYEDAVSRLMVMEVVDGYEDGTYRPANPVQRAEMAALIARAIDRGCFKVLLDPGFVDTEGHWAARGIAKTYNAGIVKGLSDTHFGPTLPVTYAQAMTMILRAIGYTDDSLGGTWPANYLAKAQELGLTSDLDPWTSDAPATRGNIALMLAPQAQAIRDYWAATVEDEEQRPENGAGKLANFSGRAIGLPIAVASVLNEKGEAVDEIEFLMGDETYYLQTRKKGTVKEADFKNASAKFTGDLYALIMNDGIVREIKPAATTGLKRYVELTENAGSLGGFRIITAHKNQRITITNNAITDFAYAAKKEDVSIYEAVFDRTGDLEGFRSVTASAIDAGDYVRAWDLSADYAGVAVVLVLIDKGDFAAAKAYGIL
ncbi:MAG: S-layer homology domain-containing protein [Anaerovoracaceae bacterium]